MKKPTYKVKTSGAVARLVRKLHPHIKTKVMAGLQAMIQSPDVGKALKHDLDGLRSFQVSGFRLIYRVWRKRMVELIAIGPKERIYEDTFRIIGRESKK